MPNVPDNLCNTISYAELSWHAIWKMLKNAVGGISKGMKNEMGSLQAEDKNWCDLEG